MVWVVGFKCLFLLVGGKVVCFRGWGVVDGRSVEGGFTLRCFSL